MIIAGMIGLFVTWLGSVGVLFFGLRISRIPEELLFGLPVLVFPLYLIVWKSLKLGCILMWSLLIANCILMAIINGRQIYLSIALSRVNEALLAIAILTQSALYLQGRRPRQ